MCFCFLRVQFSFCAAAFFCASFFLIRSQSFRFARGLALLGDSSVLLYFLFNLLCWLGFVICFGGARPHFLIALIMLSESSLQVLVAIVSVLKILVFFSFLVLVFL